MGVACSGVDELLAVIVATSEPFATGVGTAVVWGPGLSVVVVSVGVA